MKYKAIETMYRGLRFRSRLEARTAVFYDALGVQYEYEPEGFDLGGIWYLPDFWLPKHEVWIEVKGASPNEDEIDKAKRLTRATKYPTLIFSGGFTSSEAFEDLGAPCAYEPYYYHKDRNGEIHFSGDEEPYDVGMWEFCPRCKKPNLSFYHGAMWPDGTLGKSMLCTCKASTYEHTHRAYLAARQARFEHGQ